MNIGGLQRSSTLDYPGYLSCVVFTPGCNLNCFYCHNRELLSPEGESVDEAAVFAFLEKRRGLLDGVVISGGEPTLQPDLPEFLSELQKLGYRIKLDTNGQRPEVVAELLTKKLLDYIAVDWKAPEEDFLSVCGGRNGFCRTQETLSVLSVSDVPYEARTTLYPGLSLEQLFGLAKALPPLLTWRLNFYHIPEDYLSEDAERIRFPALTREKIRCVEAELRRFQPNLIF